MRIPADTLVRKYQENIFRAAFSVCRDQADAEDIVQDTFIQYLRTKQDFASEEHIKAWLLRTAINKAKNLVKAFWRRNRASWEEAAADIPFEDPKDRELVEAVLALPKKHRVVIHLYYYEGYSVAEIGQMLGLTQSAVKNRLLRARKALKESLKEEWSDDE